MRMGEINGSLGELPKSRFTCFSERGRAVFFCKKLFDRSKAYGISYIGMHCYTSKHHLLKLLPRLAKEKRRGNFSCTNLKIMNFYQRNSVISIFFRLFEFFGSWGFRYNNLIWRHAPFGFAITLYEFWIIRRLGGATPN